MAIGENIGSLLVNSIPTGYAFTSNREFVPRKLEFLSIQAMILTVLKLFQSEQTLRTKDFVRELILDVITPPRLGEGALFF